MAKRPIFIPNTNGEELFKEIEIEFKWHSGFSIKQKKRSIEELHNSAKYRDFYPLLEASTKSDILLGQRLSAFNLEVKLPNGRKTSMESAFQGSKVFEGNIQYTDIYDKNSLDAKRDKRLKNSGKLIGFRYFDNWWDLEPKTAFYDWLYISTLSKHKEFLIKNLLKYKGFTDIEFNPQKSFNCQARSSAILVSMLQLGILESSLSSKEKFINSIYLKYNTNSLFE